MKLVDRNPTDANACMEAVAANAAQKPAVSMLFLPLLLYWAPSPMRFSKRLLRAAIGSGLSAALFGPLLVSSVAIADDSEVPSNPLRQAVIDTDEIWGQAPEPVANDLSTIFEQPAPAAEKLVAGSKVSTTKGRFSQQDSKWLFVPKFPEFSEVILPKGQYSRAPINIFRVAGDVSTEWSDSLDLVPAQATESEVPDNPLRSDQSQRVGESTTPERIVFSLPDEIEIQPNLMIQRIVNQIHKNESASQWNVSGEIIKHGPKYRLLIPTATPIV